LVPVAVHVPAEVGKQRIDDQEPGADPLDNPLDLIKVAR
jgi:hypothetical protein